MDFDDILVDIGEYGRYQKLIVYFVLLPAVFPCGFHLYNQLFMSLTPEHWCRVPGLSPNGVNPQSMNLSLNWNKHQRQMLSVPTNYPSATTFEKCRFYDVNYTALFAQQLSFNFEHRNLSTVTNDSHLLTAPWIANSSWPTAFCRDGWEYDSEPQSSSVVSDWDLVCDREMLVPLALSVFSIGGLVGNVFCGYMQDRLGRRPTFFMFLFVLSVFGIATAFAPNYPVWVALRFFNGLSVPAVVSSPYVLDGLQTNLSRTLLRSPNKTIELVGPSHRALMSVLINIIFSLILILLSVVVYLVQEWNQLALATTVPFIAFFLYWWVLPESPRWLLAHEKFEEAEKIIRTIAHVNRVTLRPDYFVTLKRKFQVEASLKDRELYMDRIRHYEITDLLRTPNLRRKTLIITTVWFAIGCGYTGLSYYAPILSNDHYLNFFLGNVAELPTYIFLWPSMEYWGRRWTLWISLVIAGCACVVTIFVPENQIAMLVLYCVGKFGVSSAYVVLPLAAGEIYPTVVRGLGTNFSSFISMTAPIAIPFVNYLGETNLALPLLLIGILLFICGFLSLLLPETMGQRLPQTLEDGEEIGKDDTWRDHFRCCPSKHNVVEQTLSDDEDFRYNDERGESPLRRSSLTPPRSCPGSSRRSSLELLEFCWEEKN